MGQIMIGDEGICQPEGYNAFETGQNLRAFARQAIAAYREGKKTPPAASNRQHGLSQKDIDSREDGWEKRSNTTVAMMRRIGIK